MTENKCLVCNSPHREWIENEYNEGRSARDLSKALKDKHNVEISHSSISNHLSKHIGGDSDRTAVLEARVRNLEMWLKKCIPGGIALNWFENDAGGFKEYSIGIDELYLSSIPESDGLTAVENALKSNLKAQIVTEQAAKKESQRLDIEKRKAIIEKEKVEREEMAAHVKEEAEKERIDRLREQVKEFDSTHKTT